MGGSTVYDRNIVATRIHKYATSLSIYFVIMVLQNGEK